MSDQGSKVLHPILAVPMSGSTASWFAYYFGITKQWCHSAMGTPRPRVLVFAVEFHSSLSVDFGVHWVVGDELSGDSQILVDVDQEGLAIGEMLQDLRKMMVTGYPVISKDGWYDFPQKFV